MRSSLAQLKEHAAASGAELIVLAPNGKLPGDMRGRTGKELWLCVPAGTDKKLICAAASHFDKVHIFHEQDNMMKYKANTFGGILLEFEDGNIAVNGGGTLAEMEEAYIVDGKVPRAMIVTCEHHHRSHNADRFCLKYHVPLITATLCAERLSLEGVKTTLLTVPESRLFMKLGLGISFTPVRYDSSEPFFFTICDGNGQIGIVPDGKIYPELAKYLFDCDTVVLGNRLNIPDNAPSALARRLQSVYNTQEELDEIFKNYDGKLYYI